MVSGRAVPPVVILLLVAGFCCLGPHRPPRSLGAPLPQFLQKPSQLSPEQLKKREELYIKLFGRKAITLDPEGVARVKAMPPGERLKLDTDGDGKIDTIYYIDNDPKHEAAFRPILVKVIDQDGDMDKDGDGDLDSDLYVVDWNADGSVDVVVEYRDLDHDNDVDEMAIYSYSPNDRIMGRDAVRVWWSRDVGDDNQLWYTINYRYQQPECQFHSHFGGDEIFSSFAYDEEHSRWIPSFENPFAFYDEDGDDLAEVTIRFSGAGDKMESMRYSFDIDNDTAGDNAHDYNFSFSCVAPRNNAVTVPEDLTEVVQLRGGPTAPLLSWRHARRFGENAPWTKVLLTWDENDNNVDVSPRGDPHERWEGVINSAFGDFPQVGGPPCGPYNKRYELDSDNSGKMKPYYSSIDRRIHLLGADEAALKVDYNYDGKVDMEIRYRDTDHDGFIDTLEIDEDGDGKFERSFRVSDAKAQVLPLDYHYLSDFYNRVLDQSLGENQAAIDAIKKVLRSKLDRFEEDPIESYYVHDLINYRKEAGIGLKIRNSREGTRYYQDLIRERYFFRLIGVLGNASPLVEQTYNRGDYAQLVKILQERFPEAFRGPRAEWYGGFSSRFPVEIVNPDAGWRLKEPVVLKVSQIRRTVPDFNPRNFVVVEEPRLVAHKEVPSQADDLDGDGRPDEVVFQVDLRPRQTLSCFIYYSPAGERENHYERKTATHRDWLPVKANIGWESGKIAYRFYYGQMDFFGKKKEELVMKSFGGTESYHKELDWGMDVLDAGKTSGIGGINIWEGDRVVPAMNPAGRGDIKIERKVVAEGPVRSTVAMNLNGIKTDRNGYDVKLLCSIYADSQYSEERIKVVPRKQVPEVIFGPGFTRMPHDAFFFSSQGGYFGSWGRQNAAVQEIGMAAIFPQTALAGFSDGELERRVKLRTGPGQEMLFYVVGDWRRGRQFPVAPTITNWEKEIGRLAHRIQNPVSVKVGQASAPVP